MIQVGWWLDTHGVPQREAALGFNEVALERGWQVRLLMSDPSFRREDCDAHVLGSGIAPAALRWFRSRVAVAAEQDLTAYGIPSVHSDYARAGELAAEHLLQRGIRDFAGFGMNAASFWRERCRAFRVAVERAGGRYLDGGEGFDLRAGAHSPEALRRWLARLPSPVGIFAGTDAWGRLLLPFVHRAVPSEVAVVGVDNDDFMCELTHPPLSSVAIPWREVGRRAGELVRRLLAGERVAARRHLVPPAGVVARRSTDMLAVPDPHVAAALAFIQRSYQRALTVSAVLREVPTHRKKLEGGFRRHVGHGIMREIRRARVEHAKRLLIMTDLPLAGVAQRSGFVSAQKMTEIFGKIAGMPPSRYRRRFRLGRGGEEG
jgi:LacI family transcriptional regulator